MPVNSFISNRAGSMPNISAHRNDGLRQPAPVTTSADGSRLVNSRSFHVGYKLDDVGPSGVASVEIFITEDDGQKWYKYGNDPDRRSPFQVDVPREGTYGFSLRVRNGVGHADPAPRAGQKPLVVIVVDTTPPIANLLQPQQRQGRGNTGNALLLRWQASDEHSAQNPIALSYAQQPHGPWRTIDGWLPNTGSYLWRVHPAAVPPQVFLRLTARDAAGNVTNVVSPRPVIVDLSKPSASILDVHSGGFGHGGY